MIGTKFSSVQFRPKDRIGFDPLQVGLTLSILATQEQLKTKGNQTSQGCPRRLEPKERLGN